MLLFQYTRFGYLLFPWRMELIRHLFVLSGTDVRKKQNGVAKLAKFCNFAGINIIELKCWTLQTHKESI